ncbi:MAG: choice-of-anchor D domain-containing protein [Pseudomonadota bacterium]
MKLFNQKRKILILTFVLAVVFPSLAYAIDPPVITPDPLEFSNTRVGQSSSQETLTIANPNAKNSLKITTIFLGDQTNFQIDSDACSNTTLKKLTSCDLTISFNPSEDGHFVTSIAVSNNGSNKTDYVTITGRGIEPAVTLSRSSIDFGDQPINTTSTAKGVTLVNSGDDTLSITQIATSTGFGFTDDCGTNLSAGSSCTINATFTPTAAGAATGTLTITDDAQGSPHVVTLEGTGIIPGQPGLSLSATNIAFGRQTVNTTSAGHDITVTSTGTVNLNITVISASSNFAQTNDCVGALAPGATCTITSTFTPPSEAVFSGTLLIVNDTADSPEEISLSGTGTAIPPLTPDVSLSTTSLEFGDQTVESKSASQTVTLTNSGTADLSVDSVVISGEAADSFTKNDDCHQKTLSSGSSCEIDIAFGPAEAGDQTALLQIDDNTSTTPQTISMDGTGLYTIGGTSCSLNRRFSKFHIAGISLMLLAMAAALTIRKLRSSL